MKKMNKMCRFEHGVQRHWCAETHQIECNGKRTSATTQLLIGRHKQSHHASLQIATVGCLHACVHKALAPRHTVKVVLLRAQASEKAIPNKAARPVAPI